LNKREDKMPLDKKKEFEGKDVADAISKACKALNVSQENLDIEVLTTGTSGIFGLCRQKTRLRVAVKEEYRAKTEKKTPKRQAKPKSEEIETLEKKKRPSSREKKKESKPEPSAKVQDIVKEPKKDIQLGAELLAKVEVDLSRLLELMDSPSDVSVSSSQENVTVLIKGEHVDEIVAENGKILDSLQYLLRKMIGKSFTEKAIISLDAGGFRANRNEELKQLGLELAADVKKSGKTRSIPSLNPSERRVVHITLQDDKDIRSRSVGEGIFKKVLIYPPGKGRKRPPRRRKGPKNK
jgi:spoIIIJ-associated protein